jgi:hypothetical protein
MSKKLINKTIESLNLSGSLKIFYDFEDYSGSYLNSVEYGDPQYSGNIINYNTGFTGQSSGSGFFDGQYISIENTSGITSESATIFFSQRKTGVSNGTIFSHLDEGGPSGWEVGINDANKLYYKNYVNGSPNYQTLDDYMYDQNVCAFTITEFGFGKIYRLNYEKKIERTLVQKFKPSQTPEGQIQYYDLDRKSFNVLGHSISNGNDWRLGSGEFAYQGYLDNFLYFDRNLNEDQIRKLSFSLYADYNVIPPVSGVLTGKITGYEYTASGVSGIVGNSVIVTGTGYNSGYWTYESGIPLTGCVGVSGVVYAPLTGTSGISGTKTVGTTIYRQINNLSKRFTLSGAVESTGLSNYSSSGSYWHFSGNSGTLNGDSAVGPSGTIFGITGFNTVTITGGYATGFPILLTTLSGNSGLLYNVYSGTPLRAPNKNYRISGERIQYTSSLNPEYYANAISLLSNQNEDYFYEILYDADEFQDLNQLTKNVNYSKYNKITPIIKENKDNHYLNFAINGVSQFTGLLTYSKNQFNFPTFNVDTGFHGLKQRIYTETELDQNDQNIYDIIYSGEKNHFHVTGLDQYAARPFASFDFENADVFLNGVKLYSGIDYIDSGGFYPINTSTGVVGLYFTYPEYSGAQSFTGIGNSGIEINHDAINPNSYMAFYNGIRQPKDNIIAHARYSDLIDATIIQKSNNLLYTMENGRTRTAI